MHWEDQAIVLSLKPYAENASVVRVLTREYGAYAGLVRGASGARQRGLWQPGNRVLVGWNARLAEHLGAFRGELLEASAARLMDDAAKLIALTAAASLIELTMAERAPHPELYDELLHLVHALREPEWPVDYSRFELALLASAGFRLDLSQCAATGTTENLVYVSPVTGRAVSQSAGLPYHAKLLTLPAFLLPGHEKDLPETADILTALNLTGYFLDLWVLQPHNRKLPAARTRLAQALREPQAA